MTAIGIGFGMMSCGGPSDNNATSSDKQTTQPSDTTYMEGEVTDGEGGRGTETEGSVESGYGNANGTELHPTTSGSPDSATQRGTDDDARK